MTDDDELRCRRVVRPRSRPRSADADTRADARANVKVTRSWQVPCASRSLVALQEKMNGNLTTHNVLQFALRQALSCARGRLCSSTIRWVARELESTSPHWYIAAAARGRTSEDTNGRKSTKWDAYVEGAASASRTAAPRVAAPSACCNGSSARKCRSSGSSKTTQTLTRPSPFRRD